MKISKSHQELSNILNNPRVLNHPVEFLGPNWKAVLNFWLFVDTLTDEQWRVFRKRYCDMSDDERVAAFDVALVAAKKTTPYYEDVWSAAYDYCTLSANATLELVTSHELLEQQKPLTCLPLFLNL